MFEADEPHGQKLAHPTAVTLLLEFGLPFASATTQRYGMASTTLIYV